LVPNVQINWWKNLRLLNCVMSDSSNYHHNMAGKYLNGHFKPYYNKKGDFPIAMCDYRRVAQESVQISHIRALISDMIHACDALCEGIQSATKIEQHQYVQGLEWW
jgi:hypothetical protein